MNTFAALLLLFTLGSGAVQTDAAQLLETAAQQMDRGDHGAAAVTLERAIAQSKKTRERQNEALAWTRLGQVYLALGAREKAKDAFRKASALCGATGSADAQAVLNIVTTGEAATQDGPSTAFLRSFDKQLDLMPGGALLFDHFWPFFEVLGMMIANPCLGADTSSHFSRSMMQDMMALMTGRELFAAGNLEGARETWKRALATSVHADLRSGFQAGIGATYLKQKNDAEAIRWFKQAADSTEDRLREIKSPELMTSYLGSERRWYYDITIETLLRNDRMEEALDYSERSRARAFLQMLGTRRPTVRRGERPNAEYASLTTIQPLRLAEIRRKLPQNTTLLVYFVSTYGVRAWVIDHRSIQSVALPFDHASLDRTIAWATSFRNSSARGFTPDSAPAPKGTSEEAFSMLIAPLRKHIHNRNLIVIPHGPLHYVPFSALRDAKSKRYLIEDYALAFSPSATALLYLGDKETPVDGGTLILGDPQTRIGALPGSAREAGAVARLFQTTAMLGSRATEDLLFHLGGRVDLVHVAAHGVYDTSDPLASHVALAPGKRDGKLEVREILAELDLRGVNLVVLSACQTAAGKRGGGDDIVGLTRAILYAGSSGVISTLWDIADEASAQLMTEFYTRLRGGATAPEALRGAQLALLRAPRYAHPQYWAAFTIHGNPHGRWNQRRRTSRNASATTGTSTARTP